MKDFGATYQKLIEPFISSQRPNLPLFSSVKGEAIVDSGLLGAAYWRENLESPVLFYTAVKAILDLPESKSKLFLEVGPHSALAGPLRQICKSSAVRDYNYVPTLVRGQDCHASLLTTAVSTSPCFNSNRNNSADLAFGLGSPLHTWCWLQLCSNKSSRRGPNGSSDLPLAPRRRVLGRKPSMQGMEITKVSTA